MNLIEIQNVSKSYKGNVLLDDASAVFEMGKIHGLSGHNGSGKSVLFKMICGFVRPDTGVIKIHPSYYNEHSDFPQQFGMIIDGPGYIGNMTGYDNLKRWADIRNKINRDEILKAMDSVGLDYNISQKVKNYSLGMKQKLALAQAIMEDQDVLILDEPFNALDVKSVEKIRELLRKLNQNGKTIIFTSHNKEDIDLLCDKVLQIRNYKLEVVKN